MKRIAAILAAVAASIGIVMAALAAVFSRRENY